MTNLILQTDIEFVQRLIAEHYPENEIVAALVRRHIDPERAARLVTDLRNGVPVAPDIVVDETGEGRDSDGRRRRTARPDITDPRRARTVPHKKKGIGTGVWIFVILLLVAIAVTVIYLMKLGSKPAVGLESEAVTNSSPPPLSGVISNQ
jgi:hypothetical protein